MASLPLIQIQPKPLVGIARLAAAAEPIREGHNVEYLTITAKSVLNRCTAKNMPFQWTINPYRGCEFACKYCYARYTHEFMELREGSDFEQKIYVKQHAAELLRQELEKVKPGEDIAIGTATDPYQPIERNLEVTRSILQELTRHSGLVLGIVTKSAVVVRDIDLLLEISRRNRISVSFTVTTVDPDLARILEPRAPRPDLRLGALGKLRQAGVSAGVICAPILPKITDSAAQLEAVVRASAQAQASYIYANPLFLKPCSAAVFIPFLKQHFPQLVAEYEQRFRDRAFLPRTYSQRISLMMARLRAKYAIEKDSRWKEDTPAFTTQEQLSLFSGHAIARARIRKTA